MLDFEFDILSVTVIMEWHIYLVSITKVVKPGEVILDLIKQFM